MLLSPLSFCWAALQKDIAYSAWVEKLLELKVNLKSFCLPLSSTSWGLVWIWAAAEHTFYSWKLQCLSKCLVWPLQEDLKPCYFLVSHGLHQSLMSFWLLLLFQEFLCSVITLCSLPLPFDHLLLPVITSDYYKKLIFTGGEGIHSLLPSPRMFPGTLHLLLFPSRWILESFRLLVQGFQWMLGGLLFLEVKKNSWGRQKYFLLLIPTAYETE